MSYRQNNLSMVIISLLIALMAALIVWLTVFKKPAAEKENTALNLHPIAVAKIDVEVGEKLDPLKFQWEKWPQQSILPGYITKQEDLKKLEGAIVRDKLHRGEPLQKSYVVREGDQGVLAAMIAPGKRAFTISLQRTANVTSLVSPGDYVDVIVAKHRDDQKGYSAETVLHRVKVLEVDGKFEKAEKGNSKPPASITVEVSQEEAEVLTMALKEGDPAISLYSFDNPASGAPVRPAEKKPEPASILSQPPAPMPNEAPHEKPKEKQGREVTITILRGDKKEELKYQTEQTE